MPETVKEMTGLTNAVEQATRLLVTSTKRLVLHRDVDATQAASMRAQDVGRFKEHIKRDMSHALAQFIMDGMHGPISEKFIEVTSRRDPNIIEPLDLAERLEAEVMVIHPDKYKLIEDALRHAMRFAESQEKLRAVETAHNERVERLRGKIEGLQVALDEEYATENEGEAGEHVYRRDRREWRTAIHDRISDILKELDAIQ